ncbi:MAG TPA: ABC transporter permease [Chthoniobacteraceae bacterium]|jgi:NitT/TauT family transport system permease protein|nr:ABC transporter permease [Chthoniobacteraceae bacterium]
MTTVSPPPSKPARPAAPALSAAARHRGLSRRTVAARRVLTALIFFAALTYGWHLLSLSLPPMKQLMFPPPEKVWHYLTQSVQPSRLQADHTRWEYFRAVVTNSDLFTAMRVTMSRLLLGYIAGVLIGVPLGILTARYRWAEDTLGVVGLGLQTLPSVCWVPLALLWFGQTENAMLFVVVMGTVWSVQIAVDNGMRSVPPIYQRAARTMGSTGLHTWWYVMLPASLPFIVSGVKQGWAFAWRSLMAAEIYVAIQSGLGLGQLLHYGRDLSAMDQVIGVMFVIVVIGLLADKILFSPWERFLHKRWGTVRT